MITPEQFQEIGETLLPLLDELTEWIMQDMIERFMIRFGRGEEKLLTGTDEWQAWVLEQAGGNLDEIQKALAKSTGKSQQEIAKIFKDSGIQAAKADAEAAAVTFSGLSSGMMAIITDAYERTVGEISNITRTMAGATNQKFIDICDAAYWKVRTGAQSYSAALMDGIKAFGEVQPIVRYPSGHKDTLEVAMLRCIRTGVAQSSGAMTIQQCKDMGWNHVLVSQHLGARVSDTDPIADHAGWQGKVYCIEGKDTNYDNLLDATGYPENPLGLCGYNCRHSFTPFLPGVSRNNNKPIDTEANRRAYETSQRQRAMERRIRAQKRKCTALHTAVKNCEDPAAKAKLQEHLKGKTLLPRVFRSQNHIDEIKGVYVPFWLFDSDADAQLRFTATRTRCWSDSKYDYTETNYYSVRRDGTLGFDAVPVDGSSKIEDDLMESIEPFAMQDAIPFQTAYLAGYVADKYDVSAEDSIERANKRIRRSTEETFQQTVTGYDSVKVDNSSIQLHGGKAKYGLFPVWLLSTSWRGENYLFAMNGQSGKFVGDLPVDKGAARKWMLGLTAALSAASYGVMWLLWLARIL